MHCFRLAHAGVVLDSSHASLLIDPGMYSSPDELATVLLHASPPAGVVITHEHPDHWLSDHLARIREVAPGCPIFTTRATAAAIEAAKLSGAHAVSSGQSLRVGPFVLEFYGGTHEVIHPSIPVVENLGVRVNEIFAYGGDSLETPPFAAHVLGIPIGSPWSNVGQIIDFVLATRPRRAYLTHDAMLSPIGRSFFASRVLETLATYGGVLLDADLPKDGVVVPLKL